ncbi:MAG TPA: TolC family protein [Thermoanaerobaculia bacterium]|jgi:outer membrane protein TolC|nr:TolC family protein [Thermoanaerobaculia bacterium]
MGLSLAEAVDLALRHDPNLRLEEARLRSTRGFLLSTRGTFDPVVSSGLSEVDTNNPQTETSSKQQSLTGTSFGVAKRFRTGFSLEPGLDLLRTDTTGPGAVNVGTFSLTLRQPLLRGRGRTALAAPEMSAERQVAAGELDLRQVTAERVLTVATQYWITRAATLNLGILRETEDRARGLLETTRKLIEADLTPAAELVQVEANLAAKEAARIGGERDLFEARQDLGREIGLDRSAIAALPLPSDGFPALSADAAPGLAEQDRFVTAALERRADFLAAHERRSAAEILRRAGDNALKPQLDVIVTPSYSGLVEGNNPGSFFSPLYRNVPGASAEFGINLSWPTANSQARGQLAQLEASREQSVLLEDLVARQVSADVPVALDAVARHAQQLERATEAVGLFEQTVINEEKKLRAGTSTLIDLITQRDRLTFARQSEVSAQLALALALLELRFQTGTLVSETGAVEPGRLTTVPFQQPFEKETTTP